MQAPKIILIKFLIELRTLFENGLKITYYTLSNNWFLSIIKDNKLLSQTRSSMTIQHSVKDEATASNFQ